MQYVTPFPGYKKLLYMQQKEEELRHSVRHNESPAKLVKAAERVRAAKLHLIKAFRNGAVERHLPHPVPDDQMANFERDSKFWEQRSVNEIVAQYSEPKRS